MASSSKASDSSSHRGPKRPDQGLGKDTSGLVALHGRLTQLRRQIQAARLASIKEKLEANRKALQRHTCALFDVFDVAAAAEAASRGAEGGNALSQRTAEGQSRLVGWDLAGGSGEREVVHVQEENLVAGTLVLSSSGGSSAQRTVVRFVKLPLVEKIPSYTTWIFLDKSRQRQNTRSGRRNLHHMGGMELLFMVGLLRIKDWASPKQIHFITSIVLWSAQLNLLMMYNRPLTIYIVMEVHIQIVSSLQMIK